MRLRLLVPLFLAALCLCGLAAPAISSAAYREYKVLLAEPYETGPRTVGAQLAAFPEVKEIDYADTNEGTPTAAELSRYDVVVSVGDSSYDNSEAWGEALATYVDRGGVVVQSAYDTWNQVHLGRFETGGYMPLLPGANVNNDVELGEVDGSSPLMQGVGPLTSEGNTESGAAPGSTVVARWANGANAVAVKGHVVAINAFLGNGYPGQQPFAGDYGRIIFNAVRALGPQPPAVVTPPAPPLPPSNAFTLGKVKFNKKAGNATVTVATPGAGTFVVSGKGVKKATRTTTAAGTLKLPVSAVGKQKKTLSQKGKVKVTATFTFTPTGGTAAAQQRKLTLKKKLG